MKKLLFLLTALTLITVGCGESNEEVDSSGNLEATAQAESGSSAEEKEENQGVDVNKGIFNVDVTLPATFFEGEDIAAVVAAAKKDGVSEVTKNDDGSLTYTMSKSKHKEMLNDMEEELKASIDDLINGEDFVSIQDISYNKSHSEFKVTVNRNEFENSFDGFALLTLGFSGMFYQAFDGVNPDKYEVVIDMQDAETGEVFDSVTYPDALDEMQE